MPEKSYDHNAVELKWCERWKADPGLYRAVATSISAVIANPVPMAVWGLIVAGGLLIGSLPVLLGLIVVMPVLGHATWHLYRKLVPR